MAWLASTAACTSSIADVDVIALARLLAAGERRQHGDRGVHAGHQVDESECRPSWGHRPGDRRLRR